MPRLLCRHGSERIHAFGFCLRSLSQGRDALEPNSSEPRLSFTLRPGPHRRPLNRRAPGQEPAPDTSHTLSGLMHSLSGCAGPAALPAMQLLQGIQRLNSDHPRHGRPACCGAVDAELCHWDSSACSFAGTSAAKRAPLCRLPARRNSPPGPPEPSPARCQAGTVGFSRTRLHSSLWA